MSAYTRTQKQTLEFAPRFDFLAVTARYSKVEYRVILIATPKMKLSRINGLTKDFLYAPLTFWHGRKKHDQKV